MKDKIDLIAVLYVILSALPVYLVVWLVLISAR